jgi:hypothetical protein
MANYDIKYVCESDGCTYCWDSIGRYWVKICPNCTLPPDLKQKILDDIENAKLSLTVHRDG